MEKENAEESSCLMSSSSIRSYTQSDGMLERGGGRRLKRELEGEDEFGVGMEEEIVGTDEGGGGGGYLGRLLLFLLLGKAGSS